MSPLHRGKVVLGYTESELCRRGSGYQFIHVADMMYCAENHVRSEFGKTLGPNPAPWEVGEILAHISGALDPPPASWRAGSRGLEGAQV